VFKTLITVSTLTILAGGSLLLAGCASDKSAQPTNQPYGLTGSSAQNPSQNPKNFDSKGHYRPELDGRYANGQ